MPWFIKWDTTTCPAYFRGLFWGSETFLWVLGPLSEHWIHRWSKKHSLVCMVCRSNSLPLLDYGLSHKYFWRSVIAVIAECFLWARHRAKCCTGIILPNPRDNLAVWSSYCFSSHSAGFWIHLGFLEKPMHFPLSCFVNKGATFFIFKLGTCKMIQRCVRP